MYDSKNFIYVMTVLECIEKVFLYSQDFDNPDEFFEANDQHLVYDGFWVSDTRHVS